MKLPCIPPLAVVGCLLLSIPAHAQHITQISPGKITYYGVSIADSTHSMAVGDSATVLFNRGFDSTISVGGKTYSYRSWTSHLLNSPCDKSHTLYGVSYYDSLHVVVIADAGLIFTTSDTGLTWNPSGIGLTGQTLRCITHTADGALIIVGDSGIILRSTDGGSNWKWIASSTILNINGISINASGQGFFVGQNGLIGKTTDFGVSWPMSTVTDTNAFGFLSSGPVTLRAVAMSPNDSAVAVGDSGAIGFTSNGKTWTAKNGLPFTNIDSILRYVPIDLVSRTSFQSVIYTYSRSFFGPGVWVILGDDDFEGEFGDSAIMFPAYPGTPGRSLDSTSILFYLPYYISGDADGGTDKLAIRFKCASDLAERTETIDYGGELEELYQFSLPNDSSYILSPQIGFFENFLFASIDSLGYGYATCTEGDIIKTTDKGFSWAVTRVSDTSRHGDDATDIHTIDSNNAFAVGWSGNLFRTTNGGITWDSSNIDDNLERLQSIAHPANGVYVVVGDFGAILRSTDVGATWTYITQYLTESFLEAVAFSSPEIGVAVGTSAEILRTTDQGVTWTEINNPLTGENVSFRQITAFPDGTYYTTTDSMGLWRSTDQGENWIQDTAIPNTIGMGFYDEHTAVVAEKTWSSAIVPDTMLLAFTRDGFTTKTEFNIPIINNNRIVFHFLDSNSFLCFGSDGFVVKVDMSQGGASVTQLSSLQTQPLQAYPNPSNAHSITIEYDLDNSGPMTIELWNELGEKVQTLFTGEEASGYHSQQLKIDPALHGAFFIKVISETEMKMLPISIE